MKKRILLVINTLGRAGAERAFIELLNNIDYEKYEVYVFVLTGMGELFSDLPSEVHLLNQNYWSQPVLNTAGRKQLRKLVIKKAFTKNGRKDWRYILMNLGSQIKIGTIKKDKLLWKLLADTVDVPTEIKETQYDTAVAFLEGGSTYFVAQHVQAKQKVAFVHVGYTEAGYNRDLDGDAYSVFHKIYTVSEDVRVGFLNIYPELTSRVKSFAMIVNHDAILQAAKEPIQLQKKGLTLVTVARLTKQKGCDLLVQTALELKDLYGDEFCWYVVGDGPQRRQLELFVKKNHLNAQVKFLGVKNNPYPYFCAADIYVQPSLFEGKSIAVQEAKILQRLMVVTDVTGMNEIIEHEKTGIICKPSAQALAKAIVDFHTDVELQQKIKENLKCLDFEKETKNIQSLLAEMLE